MSGAYFFFCTYKNQTFLHDVLYLLFAAVDKGAAAVVDVEATTVEAGGRSKKDVDVERQCLGLILMQIAMAKTQHLH